MKNTIKGALIAISVAGFFGCSKPAADTNTAQPTGDTSDMVQCVGINDCKGTGACGAADGSHSCAGKNECKGKGWVKVSQADCDSKGGSIK